MSAKAVITCAVTGTRETFRKNPAVPITPRQIAESALEAASAGAAIVHIHVRDPETGRPSSELEHYREVVERIRERNEDVVLNLTTGPGSRLNLEAAAGGLATPKARVAHVLELRPEICSLDIGTMSVGDSVRIGTLDQMRAMARLIAAAGVTPELDVFDTGSMVMTRHLIDEGEIPGRPIVLFVLGVRWGAPATAAMLINLKAMLPTNATWSAMGVGKAMFPMVAQAALLGGNVRVGLEDDIYLQDEILASSNAALVEKAAKILSLIGIGVASPSDVRATQALDVD